MKLNFLQKETSRREMLRYSVTFAGSALLAHLFSARLLRAATADFEQQSPSAADLLASMRAKSHKVEVAGASHSVYVSRPKEVAALIEEAASHARQKTL